MNIARLAQWQWHDYVNYHSAPANLLIHIITVPLFIAGTLGLLLAMVNLQILNLIVSIALMAAAMAAQGFGHAKEKVPAVPFSGPLNTLSRIFLEQLFTFPRFVITGGWYAALRNASNP